MMTIGEEMPIRYHYGLMNVFDITVSGLVSDRLSTLTEAHTHARAK